MSLVIYVISNTWETVTQNIINFTMKNAMGSLNFVNLIQAATVSVSILGCLLFWRQRSFYSISFLLGLIAFATVINLLEETGITRNLFLISPIFI